MAEIAREILHVNLEDEMKQSYLDYAMSVIVGRALPDVRDGLKPVHRRVLYAMRELGNDWNKPYKKSARVVGDVIGKYHPHGDTAVYDTIVRMAQPFSMRYLLVDGQGNFGSVDGDAPAAMRYTEVRMSRIAAELLADIDKETVDFAPNYDESEVEPTVLPTRVPNLLVNGSSGIAVGMATNIPPHNLTEVVNACVAVIDNPDISIPELMEHVPGPDFPTAGIINGAREIYNAYTTGRGRLLVRAKADVEEIDASGREAIVVTELPYQVNKARLLERIADLVRGKQIEGISELRDESDKDGMRVVIELKRGEVADIVLNNLYKQTPMESVFGINIVALQDGQPRLAGGLHPPPARGRHPAHGVRVAQGPGARPHPGRTRDRSREHRRGDRADPRSRHSGRRKGGPDGPELEIGHGAGDAGPGGLRLRPSRRSCRGHWPDLGRLSSVRGSGTGHPRPAIAPVDGSGAGQDPR